MYYTFLASRSATCGLVAEIRDYSSSLCLFVVTILKVTTTRISDIK